MIDEGSSDIKASITIPMRNLVQITPSKKFTSNKKGQLTPNRVNEIIKIEEYKPLGMQTMQL
jgi:hypothetical protein